MSGGLDSRSRAEAARLGDAGPVFRRRLSAALRRAGNDAADATRQRILGAESHHDGSLRAEIARTVSVRAYAAGDRAGVAITSSGRKMPAGKENLPGYANGETALERRWRHPVYARSDQSRSEWTWVSQNWPSARGWFDRTLQDRQGQTTAALKAALDEAVAELEH